MKNQNQQRTQHIKHSHERHNQFCRTGNGFDSSQHHAAYRHSHHHTDEPHWQPEGFTGGFCNGIDLGKGSTAQHGRHNPEEGKQLCQPFPFLSHTVLYVIHRAAANLPVLIHGTVFYRQKAFCVLGSHPQKSRHPHPEKSARSACPQSCSHTHNTSCTNGSRQSSTQGSKRRHIPLSLFFLKNILNSQTQFCNLETFQSYGKIQPRCQKQKQRRRSP